VWWVRLGAGLDKSKIAALAGNGNTTVQRVVFSNGDLCRVCTVKRMAIHTRVVSIAYLANEVARRCRLAET
jgi:DNA-binding LacI/PurR family transcriptional regulator